MAQKTEYELLLEMAAKLDPSYRTAMENARRGVQDVGEEARDASDDIGVMDIALGNLVANGISAFVSGTIDAAKSLYNLAEETREFRQDMGTLETAFSEAGFSADTATDTWEDLYAVFGEDDRAVEAANNIARMATTQEDLNDWLQITTGIWGTYQDALPVESLAEAAAETAKVGTVTGTFADALNWSSEAAELFSAYMNDDVTTAEDAFNEALKDCSTEAERQALIVDTLTTLYGGAAAKYEETAASVMDANRAQAEYLQTQAEFGEKIEPVTVAVKEGITQLMNAAMQLVGNVDFAAWAGKIGAGFSWLVNTGLPFLVNNLPTLGFILGGVTTAIVAQTVATKLKTVADLAASKGMTVMQLAQQGLNAAMKANPIGLVITAITLLVGAFVLLWNNCEGFRNFWIGLWEKIKTAAAAVGEWFTGTFVPWLSGVWDSISAGAAFVGSIFSGIKDAWSSAFTGAANAVISVLNWLIGKINTVSIGPLPSWDILGEYAGAEIGFSIPEIPMLADGGIAMRATQAVVGEGAEPEAIMPLSKLGSLLGGVTGGETISIVYSPNITVMPGANGDDVRTATEQSFEQFKAYMDRYLRDRKRLQFS